jgi:hypothetical protein
MGGGRIAIVFAFLISLRVNTGVWISILKG